MKHSLKSSFQGNITVFCFYLKVRGIQSVSNPLFPLFTFLAMAPALPFFALASCSSFDRVWEIAIKYYITIAH